MGHMPGPENTIPMMGGVGPFGNLEMGGMFTVIKVRDRIARGYPDPGWYEHPRGTVAYRATSAAGTATGPEEAQEAGHHHSTAGEGGA